MIEQKRTKQKSNFTVKIEESPKQIFTGPPIGNMTLIVEMFGSGIIQAGSLNMRFFEKSTGERIMFKVGIKSLSKSDLEAISFEFKGWARAHNDWNDDPHGFIEGTLNTEETIFWFTSEDKQEN